MEKKLAINTSKQRALELYDKEDTLKHFKSEFSLPDGYTYFSAHQLGPLSRRVKHATLEKLEEWQAHANAAWRINKWLDLEDSVVDKLSKMLHVDPQDVGFAHTLTVGMHCLLATFYKPDSHRKRIVMLKSEFNSDIIASESWIENYGLRKDCLILVDTCDKDPTVAIKNIIKVIEEHKDSISIVSMSLVSSHFCHYYDVAQLRSICNKYGIKIFLDLAHSLGCVPINLTELDVDAAVMSTSKFLNSGPGSYGGLYINPRHRGV